MKQVYLKCSGEKSHARTEALAVEGAACFRLVAGGSRRGHARDPPGPQDVAGPRPDFVGVPGDSGVSSVSATGQVLGMPGRGSSGRRPGEVAASTLGLGNPPNPPNPLVGSGVAYGQAFTRQ